MSLKQFGGVFGRNPTFNDVTIEGELILNGDTFTGLDYQGTWNASTNTPALTGGSGTTGEFYIVNVAGATDLDGITNWAVGDWAMFNGSAWQRIEGGANGNFANLDVSGVARFDDGLASSLPIASSVDPDTGLYWPSGANNFAIVTAGINRVRVTGDGDVGIGTTSPTAKLDVDGTFNVSGNTTLGDASTDTVTIAGPLTTTAGNVVINESGGDFDFRVESDTNTHALFVDAGNSRVGINNSSPTVALDVTGDISASGSITEAGVAVVVQTDVGTAPNQIPMNQYLGTLAYANTAMVAPPASATSVGQPGQLAQDGSYLYVCTALNTWKRVAIATF